MYIALQKFDLIFLYFLKKDFCIGSFHFVPFNKYSTSSTDPKRNKTHENINNLRISIEWAIATFVMHNKCNQVELFAFVSLQCSF